MGRPRWLSPTNGISVVAALALAATLGGCGGSQSTAQNTSTANRLKDDPYNPTREPDQYRVYRGIKRDEIVGFEEIEFAELRDLDERLPAFVLWTSIQRSLWEHRR